MNRLDPLPIIEVRNGLVYYSIPAVQPLQQEHVFNICVPLLIIGIAGTPDGSELTLAEASGHLGIQFPSESTGKFSQKWEQEQALGESEVDEIIPHASISKSDALKHW